MRKTSTMSIFRNAGTSAILLMRPSTLVSTALSVLKMDNTSRNRLRPPSRRKTSQVFGDSSAKKSNVKIHVSLTPTYKPVKFQRALKVNFIVMSTCFVSTFDLTRLNNFFMNAGFDPSSEVSLVDILAAGINLRIHLLPTIYC